jgi:hypothetical protein
MLFGNTFPSRPFTRATGQCCCRLVYDSVGLELGPPRSPNRNVNAAILLGWVTPATHDWKNGLSNTISTLFPRSILPRIGGR